MDPFNPERRTMRKSKAIRQKSNSRDTQGTHVFSFGDPEPVLRSSLLDYLGVFQDFAGPYYAPPISLHGLAKLRRANPHHGAILGFKRNVVSMTFQENTYIKQADMEAAAYDFAVLENCYFQKIYNRLGGLLALRRLPAITMRPGVEPGVYFQVPLYNGIGLGQSWGKPVRFNPGEVIHLKRADIEQDIYGVPEYLGGIQSVLLSEDATLFRRRFYKNGAAMGYVFATINAFNQETAKLVEAQIKAATGDGNFSNLYINIPNTNARDPIKVLPIGDIKTADDYEKIKNMNLREVLAMHRMQPGIAGVLPDNLTGFGDLLKSRQVYFELEVPPLQQVFLRLNDHLPLGGRVSFAQPAWMQAAA